jgi:plasmid replication initiation protein
MSTILIPSKKALVVKSNRLIEASYRLTEVEHQIVLYSICRSREEGIGLSSKHPLTIRAADFAKQFNTNLTKVYSQLRAAMDTLYDRTLAVRDEDPKTGKPRVIETRWISDKAYIDGAGQIQITFAPKVIPFISQLEGNFTRYRLEQIGRMSSVHAVRIYELLLQYLKFGKREISITWLKDTLQLEGQYSAIKDLKKYVVDVGVEQINEYSDLKVSYTNIKTGKAVTGFLFVIGKAPIKEETDTTEVPKDGMDFIAILLSLVPEQHRVKKTVHTAIGVAEKKYGFDYVKRNILYTNANASKSYAGFLGTALKGDWGHDWELDQRQATDDKQTTNAAEELNKMAAELRELNAEIQSLQNNSKLTNDKALWDQAEILKPKYFTLEKLYKAAKAEQEATT